MIISLFSNFCCRKSVPQSIHDRTNDNNNACLYDMLDVTPIDSRFKTFGSQKSVRSMNDYVEELRGLFRPLSEDTENATYANSHECLSQLTSPALDDADETVYANHSEFVSQTTIGSHDDAELYANSPEFDSQPSYLIPNRRILKEGIIEQETDEHVYDEIPTTVKHKK